jgi:hypothetical protein
VVREVLLRGVDTNCEWWLVVSHWYVVTAVHNMAVGSGTGLSELTACEVSYEHRDSPWQNKQQGKARPECKSKSEGRSDRRYLNLSRETCSKSKSHISVDLFVCLL